MTWRGEVVTVLPMASAPDASFTGPVTCARGWERTRGLLADKAPQLAHHGGGWLRIDSLDGLFWASEWAHQPLPERTAAMEALAFDAVQRYPSIHGVVLTSAACWQPGMAKDSWRTPGGTYGLERPLPMGRPAQTNTVAAPRRLAYKTSSRCPFSGWNGWVTMTKPKGYHAVVPVGRRGLRGCRGRGRAAGRADPRAGRPGAVGRR